MPSQPHFSHLLQQHPAMLCATQSINCKETAVFEQKRLDALMQVKAGKLTFDEAMVKIKAYEKQRNSLCDKKGKQVCSTNAAFQIWI